VEQYSLEASQAWRSRSDALAIILIAEPKVGMIKWQISDKNALIEIDELWQENRVLSGGVAERFGGFINWMVEISNSHFDVLVEPLTEKTRSTDQEVGIKLEKWSCPGRFVGSVSLHLGQNENCWVEIVDQEGVFLHIARTREEPEGVH
jgi:hypothetical protein